MTSVDDLIACHELAAAKARYCRALDGKDWQGLSDLMTPTFEFAMGDADSAGDAVVGRDEAMMTLRALVEGAKTVHQVHSPEFELDGVDAQVIWAVHDRAVFDNGISVTGYGHYYGRWVRLDGRWQLRSLTLVHLITETN